MCVIIMQFFKVMKAKCMITILNAKTQDCIFCIINMITNKLFIVAKLANVRFYIISTKDMFYMNYLVYLKFLDCLGLQFFS